MTAKKSATSSKSSTTTTTTTQKSKPTQPVKPAKPEVKTETKPVDKKPVCSLNSFNEELENKKSCLGGGSCGDCKCSEEFESDGVVGIDEALANGVGLSSIILENAKAINNHIFPNMKNNPMNIIQVAKMIQHNFELFLPMDYESEDSSKVISEYDDEEE